MFLLWKSLSKAEMEDGENLKESQPGCIQKGDLSIFNIGL